MWIFTLRVKVRIKTRSLELLLSCNYNIDFLDDLPKFYKDALKFFSELTSLYSNNSWRDQLLYNNKDILIGGKPFFNRGWYSKGILEIRDLLSQDGSFLSFSNFRNKYSLKLSSVLSGNLCYSKSFAVKSENTRFPYSLKLQRPDFFSIRK